MPLEPTPRSDIVEVLRREIADLRAEVRGRTSRSVVIPQGGVTIQDGGELTVRHPSGAVLFHVGKGALDKYYVEIGRDDGVTAFEISTLPTGEQFFSLRDQGEQVVISNDAVSGQGLARPWLSGPVVNVLAANLPTTTSATYVSTTSTGYVLKQQPCFEVEALLISNSSGTGNARWTIDGVATGAVVPITAGMFGWTAFQVLTIPGAYNSYHRLELQVQRTSGAGNVGGVFKWTQRQSP